MKDFHVISGALILSILLHSCKKEETNNTVKDIDGNVYNTVKIGTQTWMKENLRTTRYNNGDLIGITTPVTLDISSETDPKYQWAYNGKERTVAADGRLYTWNAVNDNRKVCPAGWHIPSNTEWTTLTDYLTNNSFGFEGSGNDIAKSLAAQSSWISVQSAGTVGNDLATNSSSGFEGLPSGYRNSDGTFYSSGLGGYWWSSSETSTNNAYSRYMRFASKSLNYGNNSKAFGFSVRCLQDRTPLATNSETLPFSTSNF